MKILSIDHSTRSGFCLTNTDNDEIRTWQYLMEECTEGRRYVEWLSYLHGIFKKHKPDMLVIEKPAHMRNANISRFLIGLVALEKLIAEEYDAKVIEVVPTSLKKVITGNGKAEKKDVAMSVLERYKGILEPKDIEEYEYYKKDGSIRKIHYDKADAVALNIFAQNIVFEEEKGYNTL